MSDSWRVHVENPCSVDSISVKKGLVGDTMGQIEITKGKVTPEQMPALCAKAEAAAKKELAKKLWKAANILCSAWDKTKPERNPRACKAVRGGLKVDDMTCNCKEVQEGGKKFVRATCTYNRDIEYVCNS